jgi:Putative T7SS secretion signal domain/Bacterial toxin 35
VSQLGQTSSPLDLVPGDPASISAVAGKLLTYANLLTEAGNGLEVIDTESGWQGTAADGFRAKFRGQPSAWQRAGSCFLSAAKALDAYAPVLSRAQQDAAEAVTQWDAGHKQAAQSILSTARTNVSDAAGMAASAIGAARDKAPPQPGFWSDVGGFLKGALRGAEDVGADALNGAASIGNAMVNHPADVGTLLGGTLLTAAGSFGDAGGTVLVATGIGAPIGVPVDALSTIAIGTGVTLMAASGGDLVRHAAGNDSEDPVQPGTGSSGSAGGGDSGAYAAGSPLSSEQLDEAYNSASTENRMVHILDRPEHGLQDLVNAAGGRPEAMRVIVNSLQDGDGLPANGVFEVTRTINGQQITIRGAMLNGIPKIGTAFDPSAYPGNY